MSEENTLTEEEIALRRKQIKQVVASDEMEGIYSDEWLDNLSEKWATGEITLEDIKAEVAKKWALKMNKD